MRDIQGNVSAAREIVVRVAGNVPVECENGLGERDFTPTRPGSQLLTSVQPGDGTQDPWVSDPIRICGGPDLGGDVHALTLSADTVIGAPLGDGSTMCVRLFADGSEGSVDCNGTSAQYVLVVQHADDCC